MPTIISSGRDYTIVNLALTDAYQDVNITRAANSFMIQIRNGSKVLWRRSSTDTGEFTFNEGQTYSIDGSMGIQDGATLTIGQAKISATGGTDTLEAWVWF